MINVSVKFSNKVNIKAWSHRFKSFHTTSVATAGNVCKEYPLLNAWTEAVDPGFNCAGDTKDGKALLLGIYSHLDDPDIPQIALTKSTMKYNEFTCGKLLETLKTAGPFPKLGEARLLFNIENTFPIVGVCGLGHECYGYNKTEQRDEAKEAIRLAIGAGCRAVQSLSVNKLHVESFGHAESAAEGASLALWVYQDLKNKHKRKRVPFLGLYEDCDWTGWNIGLEKASAQNLARQLMETPGNIMTPTAFSISSVEALTKVGVNVEIRTKEWAKENHLEAFLAVSRGSYEPPIFLEINYNGCDPCLPPIVLAGKGITFDSGGLCLKSSKELVHMRGDMGGAACIIATVRAIASLKIPVNIRGLIPLCENMLGASAAKPGDIVRAMNGKTILIANSDFEGQLVLADTLCYAHKYKPKFILDVGTLSKGVETVISNSASAVFTNDNNLWISLKAASIHTGDRMWRFPLWEIYGDQVKPTHVACDLTNLANGHNGFTCTIAAFLNNFICNHKWLHVDTYGVMLENGETPYMRKGMSGRPTRTLVEFIAQLACKTLEETK